MLDDGNRIVVWDTDSEKPLHTLSEHKGDVIGIEMTARGDRVLSCSEGAVSLWDIASGRCFYSIAAPSGYGSLTCAFPLDDGRTAFVGGFGRAGVVDLASGRELQVIQPNGLTGRVQIAADRQHVACPTSATNVIRRVADWTEVLSLEVHKAIPILKDGAGLLHTAVSPSSVCLYRKPTPEERDEYRKTRPGAPLTRALKVASYTLKEFVSCLAVSEDYRWLVLGDHEGMLHFLEIEYTAR